MVSCFSKILRRIFGREEDESPATPPVHTETMDSVRKEPARDSRVLIPQPEIKPVMFGTQTPYPSAPQRNFVEPICGTTSSIPSPEPSPTPPSESAERPSSLYDLSVPPPSESSAKKPISLYDPSDPSPSESSANKITSLTHLSGCSLSEYSRKKCLSTTQLSGCSLSEYSRKKCLNTTQLSGCSLSEYSRKKCLNTSQLSGCSNSEYSRKKCLNTTQLSGCSNSEYSRKKCLNTTQLSGCSLSEYSRKKCLNTTQLSGCSLSEYSRKKGIILTQLSGGSLSEYQNELIGLYPPRRPSGSSAPSKWKPNSNSVLPVYHIPSIIKHILEKDQVPEVLKKCLSPSNYAEYFHALLYAEDYYMENWSKFLKEFKLSGVTLRLREEAISGKSRNNVKTVYMDQRGRLESDDKREKKVYVEFDIDSMPERRPFLLSKDYVYVRRSGQEGKPFQTKLLLAEFGKDFHAQHSSTHMYDVWFDFNRVCLKRSHQGVEAAVDPSFRGILFPERVSRSRRQIPTSTVPFNRNLDQMEMSAVYQILSLKGPPPYLIVRSSSLRIQDVVIEAIFQICRTFKESRILIVAPQNHTCDSLMMLLKKEIPDSEMFRANAAFRERDDVPKDILSSSLYEGECFTCTSSEDLRKFKVTVSTLFSSFRLHCHGINAGHFSHIFVVDAGCATEPETMVTLANLADESTAVVLTGSNEHYAKWVRADIARENGLRRSYFKRLLESEPYLSRDPGFVKYL